MDVLLYGISAMTVVLTGNSLGEKFQSGIFYTVIGMAIVFAVLILISFLISLFKYIPKIQAMFEGEKEDIEDIANSPVDNAIAQIEESEEKELMDDMELVSVITAAIQAYRGENHIPKDGFIVRSIRKTNYGKR